VQTITVSRFNGLEINAARFLERYRNVRISNIVDAERRTSEEFSIAFAERLQTQNQRLRGMILAVCRYMYPVTSEQVILDNGRLTKVEMNEVKSAFARVWITRDNYVLFCFFGGFPRANIYSAHRLLVARCTTADTIIESQNPVQTVGYDLSCVRNRFPHNIWDQNFQRGDAISRGRIRGTAMETDPLYHEFSHIGSDIGVEIPIEGSNQKVQVIQDGRVKFMALQAEQMEDPDTRDTSLENIIQVLSRLRTCEQR
jgi:hypothetical protein